MGTLQATFKREVVIFLVALTLPVAVGVASGIGAEASTITTNDVLRAWQEREARFHSGEFVVKEVRFMAKGAIQQEGEPSGVYGGPSVAAQVIPPKDVTQEYQRTLKFEGKKLRYTENQPKWSAVFNKYVTTQWDHVWTGNIGKTLIAQDPRATFDYRGNLYNDARLITPMLELKPLLAHYRPSHGQERHLRRLSISDRRQSVGGSSCLVVEGVPGSFGVKTSIWLDPQRDFIVRRWMSERQGKVVSKLDVFYVEDPAHGWVPAHWKGLAHRGDGSLENSWEAKVVEQSINTQMKPDDFELEFPPGTLVSDHKVTSDDEQKFIVRPDGSRSIVTQGELARIDNPEELFDSKPGQAGLSSAPGGTWRYWIGGTFAVVLAIVALALVRARRVGKQTMGR